MSFIFTSSKLFWIIFINLCNIHSALPQFTKEIEKSEATLGAPFTWTFAVRAKPLADFKITKDQREVKLNERVTLTKSETEEFHYTLEFKTIESNDMGKYKIVASNKCGSATSEADLGVSGAPYFVKRPDAEVSYLEKKNARIEFEVAGIPVPEVTW